jgi:N-acetylglucosaminylphosphatidylinositol deacetylase
MTNEIYVLVIAHPDDESMFFVPTIGALVAQGKAIWILCLTTGDYDGLGKQREKELHRAGSLLGVNKVIVKDDLKDHPSERWPIPTVSKAIRQALAENLPPDCERMVVVTFDQFGVSGHVNHLDTFHGVCDIAKDQQLSISNASNEARLIPVEALQLESERNVLWKYLPVVSWIILLLSFFTTIPSMSSRGSQRTFRLNEPWLNWKAMATHESQFVWYRRLFVVFSCYTYVNKLKPIRPSKS